MRYFNYIVCLLCAIMVFTACGSNKDDEIKEVSAPTQEDSKEENIQITSSPAEILEQILASHNTPKYYSNLKIAQNWYKDLNSEIIYVKGIWGNQYKSGETIFSIDSHDDLVRTLSIYFENANYEITVNDALVAIRDLLPFGILEEYYNEPNFRSYIHEKGEKDTYWVISYSLSPEASELYYSKEHTYQGNVSVIFNESQGYCKYVTIQFGTPRWMNSPKTNGYIIENWEVDF